MSARLLKNNKKNTISKKSIIFWSAIAAAVVVLIISLIITAVRNRSIVNYNDLLEDNSVLGKEIFTQEEETYLVLFYNFEYEEEMETFNNTIYTYLEFYRNNKSKEGVMKMYAADYDEYSNELCLVDGTSNISGTTTYPGDTLATNESTVLRINRSDVPVLLVVKGGSISEYKTGESAIKTYLHGLKNSK